MGTNVHAQQLANLVVGQEALGRWVARCGLRECKGSVLHVLNIERAVERRFEGLCAKRGLGPGRDDDHTKATRNENKKKEGEDYGPTETRARSPKERTNQGKKGERGESNKHTQQRGMRGSLQ